MPAGYLLLAFQAESEPVYRTHAHGTHLPLTSYRHGVHDVAARPVGARDSRSSPRFSGHMNSITKPPNRDSSLPKALSLAGESWVLGPLDWGI